MAITNAIIKAGEKALTKGATKAVSKATTKALTKVAEEAATKAIANSVTRGLTGAGVSSLAPKAGSTLDGILGRSSGLTLKNAELPKATSLAEKYADTPLAKTAKQEMSEIAERNSKLLSEIDDASDISYDIAGHLATGKTPKWNEGDEVYDKLRKIASDQKISNFADSENQMIDYSKLTPAERDDILDGLLNKENTVVYDSVAEDYAGTKLEPENILSENQLRLIDQEGSSTPRKIAVDEIPTRRKNVNVTRPTADLGVEEKVVDTTNPNLTSEIASLKEKIGSAGGSNGGRIGGGTTTEMPGSEGFNVKLKDGKPTTIRVGEGATGSTRQQRAVRKLDDMTAKSMNATSKQYKGLVGKSGSIDNHYSTIAERMRAENIDQANVAQKAQSALSLREDIKQQGLKYAEANGVTINLSGIDNTIGLSATQKRKLAELGLGLDEMVGGTGVVTPTQAEEIYKTLRDYAYNWSDSKDALTKVAGNACEKEAEAVRDLIDATMDNINVDYKTSLLEEAAKNGEDPAYLRKLAGKKDFKFSDLRKDQSDWIAINDLAGNKIKEEPTLNVFGVDTGMKNPLTSGAEKIKEKIYEKQAYGGGAGGNRGGGSVPPVGGTGNEGAINFETVGAGAGTLRNLLGRAKGAGLVGAGILGGMALGGGGGSTGGSADFTSLGAGLGANTEEDTEADLYNNMTIGGYTYQQLEDGYFRAVQAGDEASAKLIANMMGMLDDKVERYYTAQKNKSSSSSGIAGKQKAAMNVLTGLMGNYNAQGPIAGRFTQLMNAITGGGYNPSVAAYDSGAQGSLGTIIKALGDTGALSEGDQKRALELLPKTTDSEAAAKYKYQQLLQILAGAGVQ